MTSYNYWNKLLHSAIGKSLVSISKHPLTPDMLKKASAWDGDASRLWLLKASYPLTFPQEQLSAFEKLDRQLLAAEFAASCEISLAGGILLDCGCGIGRSIEAILKFDGGMVKEIYGVDFDYKLLKICQSRLSNHNFSNKIKLHNGSITKMPFIKNHSVDYAVCFYKTFGNLTEEERNKNIIEVRKKLKIGGSYIISFGNRRFQSLVVQHFQKFHGPPILNDLRNGSVVHGDGISSHYFTRGEIISIFKNRGFVIQRLYEVGTGFIVWARSTN